VWKTLAFPGWTVAVDGHPVPTAITPEGLLAADVPAGRRQVAVAFGGTSARRRGWLISGAATLALAVMGLAGARDSAKI
jgi:hypothetical protein